MFDDEQWRSIDGFPDYQISDFGRVKSFKRSTPKILSPCYTQYYASLDLRLYGIKYRKYIHHLVADAFLECRSGLDVRHLDGNKYNNLLTNLALGTRKDNMNDARIHGTLVRGEACGSSKITAAQVIELRKLRKEGVTVPKLSTMFGITLRSIYRALTGETLKHIPL